MIEVPYSEERLKKIAESMKMTFIIDEYNAQFVKVIWDYFFNPKELPASIDHKKGLCLIGTPGFGKTYTMLFFRKLIQHMKSRTGNDLFKTFAMKDMPNVCDTVRVSLFNGNSALATLRTSNNQSDILYDEFADVKHEQFTHFGNTIDVSEDLIDIREKAYTVKGFITHMVSNLSKEQFFERFSSRTLSRIKMMCNIVPIKIVNDRRPGAKAWKLLAEQVELQKTVSKSNEPPFVRDIVAFLEGEKQKNRLTEDVELFSWYEVLKESGINLETRERQDIFNEERQILLNKVKKFPEIRSQYSNLEFETFQTAILGELQYNQDNILDRAALWSATIRAVKKILEAKKQEVLLKFKPLLQCK